MHGIDPTAYLQRAAGQMKTCTDPAQCHRWIDDIQYLYKVMDPELQDLAEQTMAAVRARLADWARGITVHLANQRLDLDQCVDRVRCADREHGPNHDQRLLFSKVK